MYSQSGTHACMQANATQRGGKEGGQRAWQIKNKKKYDGIIFVDVEPRSGTVPYRDFRYLPSLIQLLFCFHHLTPPSIPNI